jgi:hypothetical protein
VGTGNGWLAPSPKRHTMRMPLDDESLDEFEALARKRLENLLGLGQRKLGS